MKMRPLLQLFQWSVIVLFALLATSSAFAQCEVDAGEDMTVCAGDAITLGGSPTVVNANGGYTISWDQGVGDDENPNIIASATTTYEVTLQDGGCTDTDQITVTVLQTPDAEFVFGPNNDCAGTPVNFVNNTTGCLNCEYSWDFDNPESGAGNTSTLSNPSHTFVSIGNGTEDFNVTLTVTNENGCESTTSETVTITQAPEAVLTEDANFTQCLGISDFYAYVYDASTPGVNSNYYIDWGDGSPPYDSSTPPNALEHIYSGIDIWTLTYTVTGTNGCETTEEYAVTNITNPAVGAATLGNTLQCGPVDLCFDINSYDNNHPTTEYFVDFGDGSPMETYAHPPPTEVCHEYSTSSCENSPPFYTFTITADNNCTPSTVTISPIQIYTPPIASFDAPPAACVGSSVPFTNTSIGGYNQGCSPNASWEWDFGDPGSGAANTSTASDPSHVYSAPGTYTVTLSATNAGNPALACGETMYQLDVCIETAPTPAFSLDDLQGCLPLQSAATNTSDDGIPCALNTNWEVYYAPSTCLPDLGTYSYVGGTSASSDEPIFSFESVGSYDVVLEMTNTCGTFTDQESVQVYTDPVLDVQPISDICEAGSVSPSAIIDDCDAPITDYSWTMTGGSPASASTASPGSVSYNTDGNYTITLAVTNECGTSTSSESFAVESAPNLNIIPADTEICDGQSTTLTGSGGTNLSWSPSPDFVDINDVATVSPNVSTTYTLNGTSPAGCPGSTTVTIDVNPLPLVSNPLTYEICAGESVQLQPDVTLGNPPYQTYSWSPVGTLDNAAIEEPTATPASTTTYTLTVTDNEGCQGQGNFPVTVNQLPNVIAGPDIQLCDQPVAEVLTGYSPTTGGTGVWSGTGITDPSGEFTPPGVGNYTLTYTFEDTNGCENADDMEIEVIAPTQADAGPDQEYCESPVAVDLGGPGTWTGPGVTDNEFTPDTPGDFVLDYSEGVGSCLTSDQMTVTVHELPQVDVGLDATVCSGDSIQITATVSNGTAPYTTAEWSASAVIDDLTDPMPWVTPLSNESFTFTAIDDNGCSSQNTQTITVLNSPAVEAGNDITLCDQPIPEILTGFSPTTGGTGEWSGPNITDPAGEFTPNGSGVFTVYYTFTDDSGCVGVDSIDVTVADPTLADAGPDFSLCLGDDPEQLAQPGTWSGDWVNATGLFTPDAVGTFTLTITTGTGTCESTDEVDVTVNDLPGVDAGEDLAICNADDVQLDGSATSDNLPIVLYSWDNGMFLSDANVADPMASPDSETTFTLTVTDDAGCAASEEVTVFVNSLPVVDAGLPITVCDQPIEETLTGFSPTTGGTGEWTGTGITDPSGVFLSPGVGDYTLYYTFTDDLGCSNVDSLAVEVVSPEVADAGPDLALCPNEGDYMFDAFSPATGGNWSGPGVIDVETGLIAPNEAVEGFNTYYYEIGSGTCYSIDSLVLEILPLPELDPGLDDVACGNAEIFTFDDFTPTGGTWEGLGIIDASAGTFDPSIGEGSYDLIYFYTDGLTGCTDTVPKVVDVSPVPVADITVTYEACTNLNLELSNLSSGADSYLWNFGNTENSDFVEPAYTYPDPGMYTIEMIAYNDFGCSDTTFADVEAINPPEADLSLSTDEGCAPLDVEFGNESVGQYLDYEWDLSIALNNTEEPGTLTYQQGDEVEYYPISLTATNYCGSDVAQDTIAVLPQPVAGFGTAEDVDCSPFNVVINNTSVGLPDFYEWDFGDGTFSNVEEPGSHVYYTDTVPTDYTISLYLENECGVDSADYTITVLPNTVTAFFNTNITTGCSPLEVEFTDFSEGGTVITYDFGNNDITDEPNPVHVFTEPGDYTVFQYVNNGCSFDTTFIEIEVLPGPDLDFSISAPQVCTNTEVQFQNESSGASDVSWDFGDDTQSEEANPIHIYSESGTYTVTLFGTSTLNECPGQVQQSFTVLSAPDADFSLGGDVGCSPLTITFDNQTAGGNFYIWDFGDGNGANDFEPTHTFTNDTEDPVIYSVSLITENLQLCVDTAIVDVIVSPTPVAEFTLPFTTSCDQEISLTPENNTLFADDYLWTIESQGESNLFEPQIDLAGPGVYTVSLFASNTYGCADETEQEITIYQLPEVDFDADRYEGCVPLTVQFFNQSSLGDTYSWDLGPGLDSEEQNPQVEYEFFGTYDVSLEVTTADGCVIETTFEDFITIHPLPLADFTFTPEEGTLFDPVVEFTDLSFAAAYYLWSFGDGNVSTDQNPTHSYDRSGEFEIQLEVVSAFGCEDTKVDYITIFEENEVFVPNTFTPDDDGINDTFFPVLVGSELEFYKFQIFDRWGEKIFESDDPDEPWIGNYKGGDYYVKDDVYVWQLRLHWKGSAEAQFYVGHVTLVK